MTPPALAPTATGTSALSTAAVGTATPGPTRGHATLFTATGTATRAAAHGTATGAATDTTGAIAPDTAATGYAHPGAAPGTAAATGTTATGYAPPGTTTTGITTAGYALPGTATTSGQAPPATTGQAPPATTGQAPPATTTGVDPGDMAQHTIRGPWPGPTIDASAPPRQRDPEIDPTVDLSPAPPRPSRPDVDRPHPRPARARTAIALLVVVFLLAAMAVTMIVTMRETPDRVGARPSASPPFPTWAVRYADSLGSQRGWSAAADPAEKVECAFRNGRLEIDMRKGGIFRCPGQRDELTDFALQLDVFLLDGQACAGIWFRRGTHEDGKDSSYVLKVCRTELVLGHHHADGDIAEFGQFAAPEIGAGIRTVVGLVMRGSEISLYLDGRFVGRHDDTAFAGGRLALGIAVPRDLGAGRVGFSNVELRTP